MAEEEEMEIERSKVGIMKALLQRELQDTLLLPAAASSSSEDDDSKVVSLVFFF